MAMNKLNIPTTITVGFNERSDTYTKKLAYVIYTDAKGVLRKEKSWESWRSKKIDPENYNNEPTTGFVLNKKVGGNNYSWNPRNTYVRVFDPRGFEFEISVPNLLFILQETSSIKGKGLEGEFVYSWDGTELVLLPTNSQEYKESASFTKLQSKSLTKADIKEGFVYINKDNDKVMYLGRHDWSEDTHEYTYHDGITHNRYFYSQARTKSTNVTYGIKTKKKHVFVYLDSDKYWLQDGFTKIAEMESSEISPLYADKYDTFITKCPNVGKDFVYEKEMYKPFEEKYNDTWINKTVMHNDCDIYILANSANDDKVKVCKPYKHYEITIGYNGCSFKYTYLNENNNRTELDFYVTREELKELVYERYVIRNNNNGTILETIL